VVVNREIDGIPSVVCDMTGALHTAGDHVHDLGHRRIALLTGTVGSWAAEQRRDAVRSWAAGAADVELTELGPFDASYEGGRDAAAALLSTSATAAFAFDDLTACGVIAGLADAGERVPGDRSVIGCDDVLLASAVTPSLSTVSTPNARIAEEAMSILHAAIGGEETSSVHLEGAFVPRQSTDALS
jgi:DNA-binding LacI/PurR family transcriptional regulator